MRMEHKNKLHDFEHRELGKNPTFAIFFDISPNIKFWEN